MVNFNFYPVDINQKVVDNKAFLYLYGRTDKGEQICLVEKDFQPYFWVLPKENPDELKAKLEKLQTDEFKVVKVETEKKKHLEVEHEFLKVFTDLPKSVPKVRNEIKYWDLVKDCFEYDILFTRRYLIDKNIIPFNLYNIEAEKTVEKGKVECFEVKEIKTTDSDSNFEPDIIAFDIETYNPTALIDPKENAILMIALYGKDYKKIITWKKNDHEDAEIVDSEAELIEKFKKIVADKKPDILCGYFSDEFDFPYIKARADKYRIKLDLGLDYSELKTGRGASTSCTIAGICHLDVYRFIRSVLRTAIKGGSFSLDSVSKELLGAQKEDVDVNNLATDWDNDTNLEMYAQYNLQDSKLTYDLAVKLFPNMNELVKMIGLTLSDTHRMGLSQLVEWFLLKQAPDFNEIAPNRPKRDTITERRSQTYTGGFVFEPTPGIYFNVVIFDFRSLYPTIVASHNISVGTLNCDCCEDAEPTPGLENIRFCKRKKGFIPSVMEDLIERRMRVKEIIKQKGESPFLYARQMSLKLLANSFYGYLGFFGARYYSFDCAQAITAYSRHHIKKVIEDANKENFKVIYSDTDSIFLELDKKTKDEAIKFVDKQNQDLPGLMELEYEGFYPAALFVPTKASGAGAKKRYALLDDKGKINIKGFETVRRNTSIIAKETQEKVLKILLSGEGDDKALNYAKNIIKELDDHTIPKEKVIIKTQLSKELGAYESVGPHVAIAEKMHKKGIPVGPGMVISYVVCKGKGVIRDKAKLPEECSDEDYDSEYYINNQVIPVVERILEIFGHKKEELLDKGSQDKLSKFF